jgi:hypothetical protein
VLIDHEQRVTTEEEQCGQHGVVWSITYNVFDLELCEVEEQPVNL